MPDFAQCWGCECGAYRSTEPTELEGFRLVGGMAAFPGTESCSPGLELRILSSELLYSRSDAPTTLHSKNQHLRRKGLFSVWGGEVLLGLWQRTTPWQKHMVDKLLTS